MTRGYTHGILTFDYPNPLSKIREDYLVSYLEQAEQADILKTKAMITANLMSLPKIAKEASKESFDLFKAYADLLLPIVEKSAIIKDMTSEERIKIRDSLRAATKALQATPTKRTRLAK